MCRIHQTPNSPVASNTISKKYADAHENDGYAVAWLYAWVSNVTKRCHMLVKWTYPQNRLLCIHRPYWFRAGAHFAWGKRNSWQSLIPTSRSRRDEINSSQKNFPKKRRTQLYFDVIITTSFQSGTNGQGCLCRLSAGVTPMQRILTESWAIDSLAKAIQNSLLFQTHKQVSYKHALHWRQ